MNSNHQSAIINSSKMGQKRIGNIVLRMETTNIPRLLRLSSGKRFAMAETGGEVERKVRLYLSDIVIDDGELAVSYPAFPQPVENVLFGEAVEGPQPLLALP